MMSQRSRIPIFATLALLTCLCWGADPLQMKVSPAFEGVTPSVGTTPIAVDLRNDGPDARGVLRVQGGMFQMDYPIELPHGSQKRLITYPSLQYGSMSYLLLTDQGKILKSYDPAPSPEGQTALLIGDTSGEMSFLRGNNQAEAEVVRGGYRRSVGVSVQDAYCLPDLAPNRPVGYANLAAVVLGMGAERLANEQVEALKLYVLSGGTLVFVGGASAPILRDGRWRDVLPIANPRTATLANSAVLEDLGGFSAPTVSVTGGDPIPGALSRSDGAVLVTAERTFGIGKVVYLAFNPFEPPLNQWQGRKAALSRLIRLQDVYRASNFLAGYVPSAFPGRSPYVTPATGAPPPFPTSRIEEDPFSTKLPSTDSVFKLLAAYFIVVVPINFLVLKKLRRGELAWFTAPIISLGFAAAFFGSAQELYAARMSSAAKGILLVQEGMEEGIFVGSTQLFIPRSGTYDLKLTGVDSFGIVPSDRMYGFGGPRTDTSEFDPVDVGEVTVPRMQANNLAFRQIAYRQRVPAGRWFVLDISKDGRDATVRNQGPYALRGGVIFVGQGANAFGDLEPGQTRHIALAPPAEGAEVNDISGVPAFLTRTRAIALTGQLDGFRPGPQLGTEVESRSGIEFAMIAKEALGR